MATSTTNALSISTSSALLDAKATPRQPPSVSPQCVSLPTLLPPPIHSQSRFSKTTTYCKKIARNVMVMTTTGEAPATTATDEAPAAAVAAPEIEEAPAAIATDEAPAAAVAAPEIEEVPAAITTDEAPAAAVAAPEIEEAPSAIEPQPVVTQTSTETSEADPSDILKTVQEAWDKVEDKYAVSSLAVAGFVALWGSAGVVSAIDRLPLVPGVLELVGIGYSGWFAYKNLLTKTNRDALLLKIKSTYKDIIGSS